jgi:hypothetical protein
VIAYFDTSAVIPLFVAEPGSDRAASLWYAADRVVSARLAYPEARAALAHAARLGRLSWGQLRTAVSELDSLFRELDVRSITISLGRPETSPRLMACAATTPSIWPRPIACGIRISSSLPEIPRYSKPQPQRA